SFESRAGSVAGTSIRVGSHTGATCSQGYDAPASSSSPSDARTADPRHVSDIRTGPERDDRTRTSRAILVHAYRHFRVRSGMDRSHDVANMWVPKTRPDP